MLLVEKFAAHSRAVVRSGLSNPGVQVRSGSPLVVWQKPAAGTSMVLASGKGAVAGPTAMACDATGDAATEGCGTGEPETTDRTAEAAADGLGAGEAAIGDAAAAVVATGAGGAVGALGVWVQPTRTNGTMKAI